MVCKRIGGGGFARAKIKMKKVGFELSLKENLGYEFGGRAFQLRQKIVSCNVEDIQDFKELFISY